MIRMGFLQTTILLTICVSAQMFSVASAGEGTVIVGAPTNDSCVLYAGAVATGIVGVDKQFTVRTQHTDVSGPTDINYVEITIDLTGWDAVFRWTESTDTFSEQADPSSYLTLSSTNADSSSAGNQWTLDWNLTITSWSTDENSKNVRAYVIDSASLTDQDDYSSVLRVENDLTSASLAVDDYDADPSQTLTFTGYWYYDSTSVAPPDDDYEVTVKLSGIQKGSTNTTLVSGAFSIGDVTAEATVGSYNYTVEASHMTGSGNFSSVIVHSGGGGGGSVVTATLLPTITGNAPQGNSTATNIIPFGSSSFQLPKLSTAGWILVFVAGISIFYAVATIIQKKQRGY